MFSETVFNDNTGKLCKLSEVNKDTLKKFIVVKNSGEKVIIFGSRTDDDIYHSEILAMFSKRVGLDLRDVKVLGGGSIKVVSATSSFTIFGKSTEYGQEPDREETIKTVSLLIGYKHIA